jgi:hypothetical protein
MKIQTPGNIEKKGTRSPVHVLGSFTSNGQKLYKNMTLQLLFSHFHGPWKGITLVWASTMFGPFVYLTPFITWAKIFLAQINCQPKVYVKN